MKHRANRARLTTRPILSRLTAAYGKNLFFLREYERAAAQFAKTLDLHPGNAAAHEYFGDVCQMSGMLHEAITQWRCGVEP